MLYQNENSTIITNSIYLECSDRIKSYLASGIIFHNLRVIVNNSNRIVLFNNDHIITIL